LKFSSKNQLNAHNYLSILFCDFPLITRSGKSHVAIDLIGYARHTYCRVYVAGIDECEVCWYLNTWKLLLTKKQVSKT